MRVAVPVKGMGCEACQTAVRGVLTSTPGVLDARVRGTDEEGRVDLHFHPAWGFNLSEVVTRWSLPADPYTDDELGSGISWAIHPSFCDDLLPIFPEENAAGVPMRPSASPVVVL